MVVLGGRVQCACVLQCLLLHETEAAHLFGLDLLLLFAASGRMTVRRWRHGCMVLLLLSLLLLLLLLLL